MVRNITTNEGLDENTGGGPTGHGGEATALHREVGEDLSEKNFDHVLFSNSLHLVGTGSLLILNYLNCFHLGEELVCVAWPATTDSKKQRELADRACCSSPLRVRDLLPLLWMLPTPPSNGFLPLSDPLPSFLLGFLFKPSRSELSSLLSLLAT